MSELMIGDHVTNLCPIEVFGRSKCKHPLGTCQARKSIGVVKKLFSLESGQVFIDWIEGQLIGGEIFSLEDTNIRGYNRRLLEKIDV